MHDERTWSLYCGQVQTSQNRCEALFFLNPESHAVKIWPTPKTCVQFSNCTSLETLQPSQVVETALRHASIGKRCELVWSATFFFGTLPKAIVVGKLSFRKLQILNITRLGPKRKKLRLSVIPALRLSRQPRLGQPQQGVNRNFSWSHLDKSYVVRKPSISEA